MSNNDTDYLIFDKHVSVKTSKHAHAPEMHVSGSPSRDRIRIVNLNKCQIVESGR